MNEKKGIVVYHGGRKFSGPVDILPKASKNAQNGPGFYTTTNLSSPASAWHAREGEGVCAELGGGDPERECWAGDGPGGEFREERV